MSEPQGISASVDGVRRTLPTFRNRRVDDDFATELESARRAPAPNQRTQLKGDLRSGRPGVQPGSAPGRVDSADAGPYADVINSAARKYNVDPTLVAAVARAESNLNPKAVSRAGARGLMQLMPATARQLGVDDAFDPEQNVDGGTKFLGDMLKKFKTTELALAAYNAGPGAVKKFGGIPPYRETQTYISRVLTYQRQMQAR